ncbi:ferritin [Gordonia araii NBRC 100433]|uniref:Ferritin n=1 Tax=Gordonia araii NBRC 100433 TaxID=1073574 RepID=G7H4R9_9ACTN|nr:ferritin [Gordonia araii]NNG98015.1 ferritin [Gordonia araii NBRC 100433]GAB10844.1 ferritin [Gordonia araii NBRC 100433]
MKMTAGLEKAFIKQIIKEYESAVLYRQLAIELELMNLPGISKWLKSQSAEELTHADKLIKHLTDRDNHPVIGDIKTPKVKVTSVTETFDVALEAERDVSASIRELYAAADEAHDIDSRSLLDWFVSEQIEEEATVSEILGRARLVNEDGSGILRLDAELGASA